MKEISDELYEKLDVLGLLPNGVNASNVGSSNYAKHLIQPWCIWLDWDLNPWDADIVKRILRTKKTDSRKQDYEKIIHICRARIRQIEMIEKYGEKKSIEETCIISGNKYVCVEDWIVDCGDKLETLFTKDCVYDAVKDGYLWNNNLCPQAILPNEMKKYFKLKNE